MRNFWDKISCAPNLLHVLMSRTTGYHNLCSPAMRSHLNMRSKGENLLLLSAFFWSVRAPSRKHISSRAFVVEIFKRWQPLFTNGDNFAKVQLLIQVVQYPDWKLGIVSKLDCQGIKLHPGGLAGTIWTLFSFPSQHNSILIRNIHISLSVPLNYTTKIFPPCTLYGTNTYF